MKKQLTLVLVMIALMAKAQTPWYLPTNGLVGWWPFNGNANDESGNNYHGVVQGATLTTDRFNLPNAAYMFQQDSVLQKITTTLANPSDSSARTISLWFQLPNSNNSMNTMVLCGYGESVPGGKFVPVITWDNRVGIDIYNSYVSYGQPVNNTWHHYVVTFDPNDGNNTSVCKIYLDGVLLTTIADSYNLMQSINTGTVIPFSVGAGENDHQFIGKIDDIGIWDRALTPLEILGMYQTCHFQFATNPIDVVAHTGDNVQFAAISYEINPTYFWQTNVAGLGWLNLPENSTYNNVDSNVLTVNSVSLQNHQQAFRIIATNGFCTDTSDVAYLTIADTCIVTDTNIVTVYDTIYVSVTDTLVITVPSAIMNSDFVTLSVYPNPTSTVLNIESGDFNQMVSYWINIIDMHGHIMFSEMIDRQIITVNISTYTAGTYVLNIVGPNNVILNSKIIIIQ